MRYNGTCCDLRLVELSDAQDILDLRLNPRLNKHLSSTRNDLSAQEEWIKAYKGREAAGAEYYFITLDKTGHSVGTRSIHNIDYSAKTYTSGSWIVMENMDIRISVESVLASDMLAFRHFGLEEKQFDVRKANKFVVRFHKKMGAVIVAEDELNYYFKLPRDSYEIYLGSITNIIALGEFVL